MVSERVGGVWIILHMQSYKNIGVVLNESLDIVNKAKINEVVNKGRKAL